MPIEKVTIPATLTPGSATLSTATAPLQAGKSSIEDKLDSVNTPVSMENADLRRIALALAAPKEREKLISSALPEITREIASLDAGAMQRLAATLKHDRIMKEDDIVSMSPIAELVTEAARSGNPTLLVETVSSQQPTGQRGAIEYRHAYTSDAYFNFQQSLRDPLSHVKITRVEFSVAFSANLEDWFVLSALTLTSARSQDPPYVYEILQEVTLNEAASAKVQYLIYAALCFASGLGIQTQDVYSPKLPKAAACCLHKAQELISSAKPGMSAESVRERLDATIKAAEKGLSKLEASVFPKVDLAALISK